MTQINPNMQPPAAPAPAPQGDGVLSFDFNNIPDVKLPPDPGVRTFLIKPDKVPYLKASTKPEKQGQINLLAQLYINEPGHKDHDKNVLFMKDINNPDDQFDIKQLFLACGIKPYANIPLSSLAGRQFQARCEHSNSTKDGQPVVYFNIREFIIDATMRNTPAPAASPAMPSAPGMPVPPAPPSMAPVPPIAPPVAPPPPSANIPAAPPVAPPPPIAPPPPPAAPAAAPPPPPQIPQSATHDWNGSAWVPKPGLPTPPMPQ